MTDINQERPFCTGGGCAKKLGAGILSRILSRIPRGENENLIVGFDSSDDAAVYKVSDDVAIVQTLDFFPPMIEDPYVFGQIAATNALSDIYAMGGEVKTALNIVCFPEDMDLNILGMVMKGGSEKVIEAGGVLAGGHSIADDTVKYGLSVMGTIHPDRVLCNNSLRENDRLILTKPLGVGIVTTAFKNKVSSNSAYDKAIKSMTTLNKYAAEIIKNYDVSACTDVTGFSFLGHLKEMLQLNYTAKIYLNNIPYISEALDYAKDGWITGASEKNRNYVGDIADLSNVDSVFQELLFDPQTSGGLMFGIKADEADRALEEIKSLGLDCAIVGEIAAKQDKSIVFLK